MPDPEMAVTADNPIRVGISSCLLGEAVRFDGGHKNDSYINGTLRQHFELVPVCPEVAIGLGTPRQPIRLVATEDGVRALGTKDPSLDVTEQLAAYGREMHVHLGELSGYIFKNRSPSCGMERVKVYPPKPNVPAANTGVGIYAGEIKRLRPLLPTEEEGRLGDPMLRENFIERVFTYHRWQTLCREGLTAAAVVAFHTQHKLAIMAHSVPGYRNLGRLVAKAGELPIGQLAEEYINGLMTALAVRATRRSHTNVLQHLMGYLKRDLDGDDKAELSALIERYRQGQVPLIVPITLLNHHFRRHPKTYVEQQIYLQPHPPEMMLRNLL